MPGPIRFVESRSSFAQLVKTELRQSLIRGDPLVAQPARNIVRVDHSAEPLGRQRRGPSRLQLERLGEETFRKPVVRPSPAFAQVEKSLCEHDPCRRPAKLV